MLYVIILIELSSLLQLKVGQVVKVTVLEVGDDGVLCVLDNDVKGFVTLDHMPGMLPAYSL